MSSTAAIQEIPSQLILSGPSSQLVFGKPESGNYTQLSAAAPAANRTISIVDGLGSTNVVLSGQGAVTQLTSITTGVTLNNPSGVITTVSSTLGALSATAFTLTNSFITASSIVLASIANYSAIYSTGGTPLVNVSGISAGSCTIEFLNVHTGSSLAGVVKISFLVC
jgi:hypothetical protein